jgi:hypothetical protein
MKYGIAVRGLRVWLCRGGLGRLDVKGEAKRGKRRPWLQKGKRGFKSLFVLMRHFGIVYSVKNRKKKEKKR